MNNPIISFIDKLRPFKFTLVDSYILNDFVKTAVGAMVLFISIFLFSLLINDLPYFLNRMDHDKTITLNKILIMYANQIPHKALWVSPLAFLFSTIYTLGNFYKNNEAVAYIGAGVHLFRLTFFIAFTAFVYSLLLIPFTDLVVVPTFDRAQKLSLEMRHKDESSPTNNLEVFGANNMYYLIKKYNRKSNVMEYPIIAKEKTNYDKHNNGALSYNADAYFESDETVTKQNVKKIPGNIPKKTLQKMKEKTKNLINDADKAGGNKRNKSQRTQDNKTYQKGVESKDELDPKEELDSEEDLTSEEELDELIAQQDDAGNFDEEEIVDDSPHHERKQPFSTKPEIKKSTNQFSFHEFKFLDKLFSDRRDNIDIDDKEKKYLGAPSNRKKPGQIKMNPLASLFNQAMKAQNKEKFFKKPKELQDNKKTKTKGNKKYIHPKDKNPVDVEENEEGKDKKGVSLTREDLKNINKIPPDRRIIYKESKEYTREEAPYFNKSLKEEEKKEKKEKDQAPKQEEKGIEKKLADEPEKKLPIKINGWLPLERAEEQNLLDLPEYSNQSNVTQSVDEKELEEKTPSYDLFQIPVSKYHISPFPAYFEYRIDAVKAVWDTGLNKWRIYGGEKRSWQYNSEEKIVLNVKKLKDGHILHEINDQPKHFLVKKKAMDRLTFQEGFELIDGLKRARKKWREFEIDLFANKVAFQLSTFLIVLVGTALGSFHSRKLVFVNSLFMAILVFLVYFVCYQLGVSIAKVTNILPTFLAPWFGNMIFLMFGIYMMTRVRS